MWFSAAPREKLAHRTTSQKIFKVSSCMPSCLSAIPYTALRVISGFIILNVAQPQPVKRNLQIFWRSPEVKARRRLRILGESRLDRARLPGGHGHASTTLGAPVRG